MLFYSLSHSVNNKTRNRKKRKEFSQFITSRSFGQVTDR